MPDWVPIRGDLCDSPKLRRMADLLGASNALFPHFRRYMVTGALARLWTRASQFGTYKGVDLVLDGFNLDDVDEQVGWPGFAEAMQQVGWLKLHEDGIHLPKYREHAVTPEAQAVKRKSAKAKAGDGVAVTTGSQAERPRNELFDAVAEVTGSDPSVTGSHVAKISNALAKAKPPYTPLEVRLFAKRFHDLCPWAKEGGRTIPTLGEIEKHIGKVRLQPAAKKGPKPWVAPQDRPAKAPEALQGDDGPF